MFFSVQCHIEGKAREVRCYEKSISSKTYQGWYVYQGFNDIIHYSVTLESSDIMLVSP